MQEILDRELPNVGAIESAGPTKFMVSAVELQDALAPTADAAELGVPAPVIVIPMLLFTAMGAVQVQLPAGMLIMSPSMAWCGTIGGVVPPVPLMTSFTSP